jgi:hypothetical protein
MNLLSAGHLSCEEAVSERLGILVKVFQKPPCPLFCPYHLAIEKRAASRYNFARQQLI